MNKKLYLVPFFLGLLAVCWVAFGYIGSNPLAFTMTLLIGAVYTLGALELRAFHGATSSLGAALGAIPETPPSLEGWLDSIHPSLQNPVRLRIDGERVSLPGPALTPYLVGLLVLLGMLGTFLGMVVTLNGAVLALESTTDLQTIRAALSAPVKGLGVAFGTSVAGVAASAMLGLLSALCRRERLLTAQTLDRMIATVLRVFSFAHQREQTFKALQVQAQLLPVVVEQMHGMMARMEGQNQVLHERLLAGQDGFYRHAEASYGGLAASVDKSLREGLTESARLAGAAIQPVAEATMAGIAREASLYHARTAESVRTQIDALAGRLETCATTAAATVSEALARQERSSEDLTRGLHGALEGFNETFGQRSASLVATVGETHAALQQELAATVSGIARESTALHQGMADILQQQLDGTSARFGSTVAGVAETWNRALAEHRATSEHLSGNLRETLTAFAGTFEQRTASLLLGVEKAQGALQADLASRDESRQAALAGALESMAAALQREWQQAGAQSLGQQEKICSTLELTARNIVAQAEAHARSTIAEIARLVDTAAEAPRAAAEVIGALREKLADSMARDNDLLEERGRIMATLNALLDAINHASTEQRGAIDSLVTSSAAMLELVGTGFAEKIESESARMDGVAAQITGSAVEVASLGEAFGLAARLFGDSNEKLIASLQRIEGALDKSLLRSDEQLAYYVAQAREVIDLSIMSQKQVMDGLQQLSGSQALVAGEGV